MDPSLSMIMLGLIEFLRLRIVLADEALALRRGRILIDKPSGFSWSHDSQLSLCVKSLNLFFPFFCTFLQYVHDAMAMRISSSLVRAALRAPRTQYTAIRHASSAAASIKESSLPQEVKDSIAVCIIPSGNLIGF
jgi:hypothetical protein